MDKRKRKEKDGESSKSKKKHKKHKKNKKSKKHDVDGKERVKKHKKHHKRSKSSDGYNSDTNMESAAAAAVAAAAKARCDTVTALSRQTLETKLPAPISRPSAAAASTLNTKFTEIMKSNGHVSNVSLPKFNNGNGADASKRGDSGGVGKVPTDPSKLVEFITKSLDPNTSTQVVSSASSESEAINDVDSPDVAVIEDDEEDLNLEELMRQKALLQARLGGIPVSDTESENSHKTPVYIASVHKTIVVDDTKINDKEKEREKEKEKEKEKLIKRRAEPVNDVILLDDSSNDASAADKQQPSPPKKKVRSSRSRSRERMHKDRNSGNSRSLRDNRDPRENDKLAKGRRSDTNDNRFKEDLRKEIDRDKERTHRQTSSSTKPGTYSPGSKAKQPPAPETKNKTQASSSFREREVKPNKKNTALSFPPKLPF